LSLGLRVIIGNAPPVLDIASRNRTRRDVIADRLHTAREPRVVPYRPG
jgi:hypothetical protein